MRKRFIFRLLLALLLITALSWLIYYTRPTKVVNDSLTKLANSDTQTFRAAISITNPTATQDILGEQATIELVIDGQFKRVPDQRDSLDAQVVLTTKTETVTLTVEANTRFIGEQAYFQITKAPPAFPALAQLKGLWMELPRGTEQQPSKLPAKKEIFTKVTKGDKQDVNGVKATTYHTVATSAAVIRMLDSIAQVLGTHLTADQITNIQQGVADAETIPADIAITPWSRQVHRISTTTTVPGSNNSMSVEFTFSDHNQPVSISVPEGAQSLTDLANTATEQNNQ